MGSLIWAGDGSQRSGGSRSLYCCLAGKFSRGSQTARGCRTPFIGQHRVGSETSKGSVGAVCLRRHSAKLFSIVPSLTTIVYAARNASTKAQVRLLHQHPHRRGESAVAIRGAEEHSWRPRSDHLNITKGIVLTDHTDDLDRRQARWNCLKALRSGGGGTEQVGVEGILAAENTTTFFASKISLLASRSLPAKGIAPLSRINRGTGS